jgi:putative ABC transport system permease protein
LPPTQVAALPFLANLHIDARVLVFSFGLSILTGMIFGLAPAIQASRPQLASVLKEGGRNASAGSGHRLRTAFVVTEIALAVVLLVGSGLLLKSLFRLLNTNPGFNPENILTMSVVLPPTKYNNANSQNNFQDQLNQRIAALPGVTATGTVDILPLQTGNTTIVYVEGEPVPPPGQETEANVRVVSESYFQTMQVPLIEGRPFDAHDRSTTNPQPVIIGKTMADRLFKGRSALGHRLVYRNAQAPPVTIIGVASDVKITGLDQELRPVIYYSFAQNSSIFANLVIRTAADPAGLAATVRHEIQALEPQAAVFNVRPMPQLISATPGVFMRRFPATLMGIFAGLALLLAAIGIYGVVSDSVAQQTHHIGVRLALGARGADIFRMVLKEGFVLGSLGVGIGVAAAFALMRLISALLFGVQTHDASVFAIVAGTLFLITLLACYLPARRATKVDPLIALRYE